MNENIGFDIDGVFSNFTKAFTQIANKKYGTHILETCDEALSWNFEDYYPITKQNIKEIINDLQKEEHKRFWEDLELLPNIDKNILDSLSHHNISFITSRNPENEYTNIKTQTSRWLKRVLGVKNPDVTVAHEKGPVAAEKGLHWFVDDKWENCRDVKAYHPECKVYLVHKPHNQHVDIAGVIRINSVHDVVEAIHEYHK